MPLSINPNALVPFVLERDEALPEPRPTFQLRFLTYDRRTEALSLLGDALKADEAKDRGKVKECLDGILAIGVARCDAMPDGFKPTAESLTDVELWELATACIKRPRLSEEDLKNSGSRHSLSTDNSAGTAPAASAATSPPNTTSDGSSAPSATASGAPLVTDGATSS